MAGPRAPRSPILPTNVSLSWRRQRVDASSPTECHQLPECAHIAHRRGRSGRIPASARGLLDGPRSPHGRGTNRGLVRRGGLDADATTPSRSRTLRPRHAARRGARLVARSRDLRPHHRCQRAVPELRWTRHATSGTRGPLRELWPALDRTGNARAGGRAGRRCLGGGMRAQASTTPPGARARRGRPGRKAGHVARSEN